MTPNTHLSTIPPQLAIGTGNSHRAPGSPSQNVSLGWFRTPGTPEIPPRLGWKPWGAPAAPSPSPWDLSQLHMGLGPVPSPSLWDLSQLHPHVFGPGSILFSMGFISAPTWVWVWLQHFIPCGPYNLNLMNTTYLIK